MSGDRGAPWKTVTSDLGDFPFYIVEFDKDGACRSPLAVEDLLEASKTATDVVLFSHGWNNDWASATGRYDRFIEQFIAVRHEQWNPPGRAFAPVLVGVFWPSAVLVTPSEQGPTIASAVAPDADAAVLADELAPDEGAELLKLVADPGPDVAADLARLLAPLYRRGDEFDPGNPTVTADDVLAVWRALAEQEMPSKPGSGGGFIDDEAAGPRAPTVAGFDPVELIRAAIRATTVLAMKDRAGRVGARGVADLLRALAESVPQARIALVGHSYGCKVVLSALCSGPGPNRPIDSVLLLEPALSCYAFSDDIDGHPGGYRPALDRVRQPVITTYSANDVPLRSLFHLAVRRNSDLGEPSVAGQPPSKYAAMGGYGPAGVEADWIPMPDVGHPYPVSTRHRIIAVDGSHYIPSHGKVESPQTAWALLSQLQD